MTVQFFFYFVCNLFSAKFKIGQNSYIHFDSVFGQVISNLCLISNYYLDAIRLRLFAS